jgi:hypothetical protein
LLICIIIAFIYVMKILLGVGKKWMKEML